MLEILNTIIILVVLLGLVLLPIVLLIKAAQALLEPPIKEVVNAIEEVRQHNWTQAGAIERERIVRRSCGWRVIGRLIGAGALVAAASMASSSVLAVMLGVAAWRAVRPIREELRDACTYKSTGAQDEPRN